MLVIHNAVWRWMWTEINSNDAVPVLLNSSRDITIKCTRRKRSETDRTIQPSPSTKQSCSLHRLEVTRLPASQQRFTERRNKFTTIYTYKIWPCREHSIGTESTPAKGDASNWQHRKFRWTEVKQDYTLRHKRTIRTSCECGLYRVHT